MLACVLSPLGGSGKTTVALNTARAGVLAGKKVLAVELDFSPGSFRSLLQIERGKPLPVRSTPKTGRISSLKPTTGLMYFLPDYPIEANTLTLCRTGIF